MRGQSIKNLIMAGIIAALYLLLTLPFLQISFGLVQFRLAEALAVLPILTSAAIPGIFLGCLLANLFNPQNLGLIDILAGSLASLIAAYLSFKLGRAWRDPQEEQKKSRDKRGLLSKRQLLPLFPPIIINALTVGIYLPYLLFDKVSSSLLLLSVGSLALSQSLVIFLLGLPLLIALERSGYFKRVSS